MCVNCYSAQSLQPDLLDFHFPTEITEALILGFISKNCFLLSSVWFSRHFTMEWFSLLWQKPWRRNAGCSPSRHTPDAARARSHKPRLLFRVRCESGYSCQIVPVTGMQACGRQPVSLRAARNPAGPPQFGVFVQNQRTTEGRKDLGVTVGHIITLTLSAII